MTVAAMQIALMKAWAQRSYRVAMRRQSLSVCPARDTWLNIEIGQRLAEPIAVISLVGDQGIGGGECRQHDGGAAIIADLAFREQ
jgi:hypothetical protein